MSRSEPPDGGEAVRVSGYANRFQELFYRRFAFLYEALTAWAFLPLGGAARVRRTIARWAELEGDQRMASLCCGTGRTERACLEREPRLELVAIDLSPAQIRHARRRDGRGSIEYRVGDATSTGLPGNSFDRVLVAFALHEMARPQRRAVMGEARRLLAPGGQFLAVDYRRPDAAWSRLLQAFWWFFWFPGNPEIETVRDLFDAGLASEVEDAGFELAMVHRDRLGWIQGVVAVSPDRGATGNTSFTPR